MFHFKSLGPLVALLSLSAAQASPIQSLEENYATFQQVCEQTGEIFKNRNYLGLHSSGEDMQVCSFVSTQGQLHPTNDDHYKLIVNWKNSEDSWDELSLYYNNAVLLFGDRGMPEWTWDGMTVLKDQSGAFALVAERSAYGESEFHYFVVQLNKDQSCRIQVKKEDRFQGLNAFRDKTQALKMARALQSRSSQLCQKKAQYIN